MHFSSFISGAVLFHLSIAGYVLEDDYSKDFYSKFDFFTAPDPTNGFVKYISQADAQKTGLIKPAGGAAASWGVDSTNKTPGGRPSIRITSKKAFDAGLVVLDVEHMPVGCGTWPAFWMVGSDWPRNGEIDILEGVNDQETNAIALHTSSGCSVSSSLGSGNGFTGKIKTPNCDVAAIGQAQNAGCGISQVENNSYGKGLNDNKGGVYATEWADDAITVWFFPRQSIPKDIASGSPDPKTWPKPAARFGSSTCNIKSMFNKQKIVFDTTFCGDWAGNVWSSGGCASKAKTCNAYVQDNPSAFTNAFWTVNSLKVFQNNGKAPVPSSAPPAPPKTSTAAPSSPPKSSVAPPAPPKSSTPIAPSSPPKSSTAVASSAPPKSSNVTPSSKPSATPSSAPTGTGGANKPSSGIPLSSTSILPTAVPITGQFPVVDPSTLFGTAKPTAPSSGAASGASSKATAVPSAPTIDSSKIVSSRATAAPSANPNDGSMPDFTWPVPGSRRPRTSTGTAPFPTSSGSPKLNSTIIIADPTRKLNSTVLLPTTIKTIPSSVAKPTSLTAISKVETAGPPKTSGGASASSTTCTKSKTPEPQPTVIDYTTKMETVVKTVVVTVPPTPAKTPTPYGRQARQVRQQRKRLVAHNGRR